MLKIRKTNKKEIENFARKEWKRVNFEHYGKWIKWVEKDFIFKAVNKGSITGYVIFKYEGGVVYISQLIVAETRRGEGIGKRLMEKTERKAKELGAHKVYLFTGKKWKERRFYEKLGYKKTVDLPKHFLKDDFVIYSKII